MGRRQRWLMCLVAALCLWPALVAAQPPNRQADVEAIRGYRGSPSLATDQAAEANTRATAAIFEFGWTAPDGRVFSANTTGVPRGVRRSGGGGITDRRYGDEAIDYLAGQSSPEFQLPRDFQWTSASPGTFVPASRRDLPGAPRPPPPPPPPTGADDVLDHDLTDYAWMLDHGAAIDAATIDWFKRAHTRTMDVTDLGFLMRIRLGREFTVWEAAAGSPFTLRKLLQLSWPLTSPSPSPQPAGRTRGDFLYPYFGPAYMSYPLAERLTQFDAMAATGATDILIMAQWDAGHVHHASGWAGPHGFNFQSSPAALADLVATIGEARARGLRVWLTLWDQAWDTDAIVAAFSELFAATTGTVEGYSPAFEIDEKIDEGEQVTLFQRLSAIAPGAQLAAHFNIVPEDAGHWVRMRDDGVTHLWAQYGRSDSLATLGDKTRRWIAMLPPDVAFVAHEWSAPAKNSQHSPAVRDARWSAIAVEMRAAGRPLHSLYPFSGVALLSG